jgi:hypothetical protein
MSNRIDVPLRLMNTKTLPVIWSSESSPGKREPTNLPLASVHELDRYQHAHLRRNMDHRSTPASHAEGSPDQVRVYPDERNPNWSANDTPLCGHRMKRYVNLRECQ